jgi:UDP-glucose 4-epimerase
LVAALLDRGDRVRVLDDLSSGRRENVPTAAELIVGDVADEAAVADAIRNADGIFHLAAVASVKRCTEDWLGGHRTNLTGTLTIFDAASRSTPKLPVIYASSAAVYGDNDELPLAETAKTQPLSSYGADKLACELHAQIAWSVHGVANVGLRFFNVYGPRQDPSSPYSGVISIFADRISKRTGIEIFGDGRQTRDFIYVDDVARHLLSAMGDLRHGARVFNVCTGRPTSVAELANAIARIVGHSPEVNHGPARTGDIRQSVGDPRAARKALDVPAPTGMSEGLRRTLEAILATRTDS